MEFQEVQCYFSGENKTTQVFQLGDLTCGHSVSGPAIFVDQNRYIDIICVLTTELPSRNCFQKGDLPIPVLHNREVSNVNMHGQLHVS